MIGMRSPWWKVSALALCLCTLATSCAHQPPRRRVGVNIESRPTPAPPDSASLARAGSGARTRPVVMSDQTRRATISSLAADTAAARATLNRCAGRKLLPDQEGVFESTIKALMDVRAMLATGKLSRAVSFARQARQLSTSLTCR